MSLNWGVLIHIVSGCSHLVNRESMHRHNQAAKIIHQQPALQCGLVKFDVPYYRYNPTSVLENSCALLFWDRSIVTDWDIARHIMIVDITISHNENLVKTGKEKLSKYLDLDKITAIWKSM